MSAWYPEGNMGGSGVDYTGVEAYLPDLPNPLDLEPSQPHEAIDVVAAYLGYAKSSTEPSEVALQCHACQVQMFPYRITLEDFTALQQELPGDFPTFDSDHRYDTWVEDVDSRIHDTREVGA